jgi:hypothetical protein
MMSLRRLQRPLIATRSNDVLTEDSPHFSWEDIHCHYPFFATFLCHLIFVLHFYFHSFLTRLPIFRLDKISDFIYKSTKICDAM